MLICLQVHCMCVIDHNYVGEFGVVYKAHLLTDEDVGFTAVAVKTLKGIETTTMLYIISKMIIIVGEA